jgi:diguanylate cyclase (GGDEF)-like protein
VTAYELIAYPLLMFGFFSLILGAICFSRFRKRNIGTLHVGFAILCTAFYALLTGTTYLRAGMGLSYELTYRLCWIGYVGIPGIIGLAFTLRKNVSPILFWINRGIYLFWFVVMILVVGTDLVDIAPKQLIPYGEIIAPWELGIRGFSMFHLGFFIQQGIVSFRNSQGIQRSRAGYLLMGISLYAAAGVVLSGILQIVFGLQLDPALTSFFCPFFAVPLAYSMTRYRMLDIRTILSHLTLAFGSTALFGLIHLLLFRAVQQSINQDLAVLIASVTVGLILFFTPVARTLKRITTNFYRRGRESYSEILSQLNRLIVSNSGLEDLLRHYGQTLKQGIGAEFSTFYLVEDKTLVKRYTSQEIAAGSVPTDTPNVAVGADVLNVLKSRDILVREELFLESEARNEEPELPLFQDLGSPEILVPLTLKEVPVGFLALGPKNDRSAYSREDLSFLDTAGIQVALAAENARLFSEAATDGLTGLFHQKYFKARLAAEFTRSKRHDHVLGVVLLDIDHFKSINDRFGHLEGDHVLKQISGILRGNFRAEDVVARYGGEEFGMLLLESDADKILQIAERTRALIEKSDFSDKYRVTASLGAYVFDPKVAAKSMESLEALDRADQALYQAKRSGRNRVVIFQKKIEDLTA